MTKPTKADKAAALLTGRRVSVLLATSQGIWALVRGDDGTYRTKLQRAAGRTVASCTCDYSTNYHPARADCSHTEALRMIWTGGMP